MRWCPIYYECCDFNVTRRHATGYKLHGSSNKKFYKTSLVAQLISCVLCFIMFTCGMGAVITDGIFNNGVIEQTNEVLVENSEALTQAFGTVEEYRQAMWRSSALYSIFVATSGLWCMAYVIYLFCFCFYNDYLVRVLLAGGFHIWGFISCAIWIILIQLQRDEATSHVKEISDTLDKGRRLGIEYTEHLYVEKSHHSLFYYCERSRLPTEKTSELLIKYNLCPSNRIRVCAIVFLFLELIATSLVILITFYWRRTAKRVFDMDGDSSCSSISSYSDAEESSMRSSTTENINYEISVPSDASIKPTNYQKLSERR